MEQAPDCIGRPLQAVLSELAALNAIHEIVRTCPTHTKFVIDDTNLYVVRQQYSENTLLLTVAAKMGKEVS